MQLPLWLNFVLRSLEKQSVFGLVQRGSSPPFADYNRTGRLFLFIGEILFMKKIILSVFLVLAMFMFPVYSSTLTPEEEQFVEALNEYRESRGLHPVEVCFDLSVKSKTWSETMRNRGTIWHDRARGDGSSEICAQIRENCGLRALRAWQGSRGHNSILLSPRIEIIGVGSADRNTQSFWTMRGLSYRERERTVTRTPIVEAETGKTVAMERTVERTVSGTEFESAQTRSNVRYPAFPLVRALVRGILR